MLTSATSAYVGIRRHTSAYIGIRQHKSAYVSIRLRGSGVSICTSFALVKQAKLRTCSVNELARLLHESNASKLRSKASKLRTCSVDELTRLLHKIRRDAVEGEGGAPHLISILRY
jgi:hypothetical protein